MDTMDAAHKLVKEFGVDWSDARKAVDSEAQDIRDNGTRINYSYSVDAAYVRVAEWITTADEYSVKNEWQDLARFVASHRPACVWAVLTGKAIACQKQDGE